MLKITQRQAVLFSLGIQLLAIVLIAVSQFIDIQGSTQFDRLTTDAVALIYALLLVLYWRSWDPARYLATTLFTLILCLSLPEPFITRYAPMAIVIPLILALVLTEPAWLLGNAVAVLVILLARAGFHGVYTEPVTLSLYLMIVGGLVVSRLVVETARQQAEEQAHELTLAYDATIEGWSRALDLRDKETEGHTRRVTEHALRLARAMNLGRDELVHIRRGALLHDMGKLGIPDDILHKPALLNRDEWAIMRKHPTYAYEMLSPIPFLRPALDIPYCHHEKWDGSGYPRGLQGEQIPLAARIFAIVDVWDGLRSDRPYRESWPEEKVRAYIREEQGKHFDPQVVDVFLALLDGQ